LALSLGLRACLPPLHPCVVSPAQAGCRAQDAQNALRRAMEAHSKVTPAQARACAQDAQDALRRTMEAHSKVTPAQARAYAQDA